MAEITLKNIVKKYGDGFPAVNDVSLDIKDGEFMIFVGPSGCGKTTTLRMIAGFETPTSGSIRIDGREVTGLKPNQRNIGMVFQSYALFPHLTTAENVGFGLKMLGRPAAEVKARVAEMLALVASVVLFLVGLPEGWLGTSRRGLHPLAKDWQIVGLVTAAAAIGVLLGTAVGVLPGLGPVPTIAMLLPLTFGLPPVSALIMLAGIYYGAQYGGSTTAILINMPGESSSAVTAIDGYQMARKGRAGTALATAALGSFFAGSVATFLVAIFAPPLTTIALKFGAAEYFSLMVMGLVMSVALAHGSVLKALAMVVLGLLLSIVIVRQITVPLDQAVALAEARERAS